MRDEPKGEDESPSKRQAIMPPSLKTENKPIYEIISMNPVKGILGKPLSQ